jgi:hypothetical protein
MKSALIPIEGPKKATRGRVGGGELEPIKILRRNLTCIPESI